MGLYVNTNVSALNAQRQLFNSSNAQSKALERLSSGFRINGASDDAAGLQISDRMTSQISGLNQAVRNANDGISLTQTAEGALEETTTNLQRIRQLAVQAKNGINRTEDNDALQQETDELLNEINRIANTTSFAGSNLLKGDFSASFMVGANAGQTINVGLTQFSGVGFGVSGLGISGLNLLTGASGSSGSNQIDSSTITGASTINANATYFNISDSDIGAGQSAEPGTYNYAVSSDGGATYQEITVEIVDGDSDATVRNFQDAFAGAGITTTVNVVSPTRSDGINGSTEFLIVDRSDNPGAGFGGSYDAPDVAANSGDTNSAISLIDGAISRIGQVRADLGSLQNRFQSTIRNLSNIVENVTSARSRIRDADFAAETAGLTKSQIMQQASITILSQANQRPQAALSLLG
uniref:flagellin N-terminal helical domain-containing protein n=1 Tax=Alteromonas gilva TaxID=2987522 RepID=UPI002868769C|nr:flagellin [Alteromonas gilva]